MQKPLRTVYADADWRDFMQGWTDALRTTHSAEKTRPRTSLPLSRVAWIPSFEINVSCLPGLKLHVIPSLWLKLLQALTQWSLAQRTFLDTQASHQLIESSEMC